jgi:hypothetical protein
MTHDRPPQFRLTGPDGAVIAVGSMNALMERVVDSRARKDAEGLLRDAAVAAGRVAEIDARVDAVIEREREVAEREQALCDDAIRRLIDGILKLEHRLDAFEQRRIADELARLPDPDSPEPLRDDHGDLEPLAPSHPVDKEELEAISSLSSDRADASEPSKCPGGLDFSFTEALRGCVAGARCWGAMLLWFRLGRRAGERGSPPRIRRRLGEGALSPVFWRLGRGSRRWNGGFLGIGDIRDVNDARVAPGRIARGQYHGLECGIGFAKG